MARCLGAEYWGMARGDSNRHAVTRYLEVLQRQGVDTTGAHPRLELTEAEYAAAHHFLVKAGLTSERLLIGIHPGGNWEYKLWQRKNYADVASILAKERNATILLFAGPERTIPSNAGCRNDEDFHPFPSKRTILRHLAALISACDVYIGNDTGPMQYRSSRGNTRNRSFRFNKPHSEWSLR